MNFALRIKELREENNLTQMKFAQIFDIGLATIAMWETDDRIPPAKMLAKIADYFNVSVDYLLGRTESIDQQKKLPAEAGSIKPNQVKMVGKGGEMITYELDEENAQAAMKMLEALSKK